MSKIPQEAVRKNCQLVIDDLAERFSNGSPTANDYVDYMGRIVDVAIHSFEAANAARAQGAEGDNVLELATAKEAFRRLQSECKDGLDALSDIDDFWDACPYRENRKHLSPAEQLSSIVCELNAAHDKLAALATPPAPQPTDRERVMGEILQDLVLAVDNDQNLGDIMRKARAALSQGVKHE